jgi:hypothetical protein
MAGGRPTKYSEKLGIEICKLMCEGKSLKEICDNDNMPHRSTVHEWLVDGKHEEFSDRYDKAYEIRAEIMFDELLEIADDGTNDWMERQNKDGSTYEVVNSEHIQRSKLRCDVRKFKISKMIPKKFGDKLHTEHSGEVKISPYEKIIKDLSDGEPK